MADQVPSLFTVTVTGGTGTANITVGGTCLAVGIKPPSGAVYDFELTDADGFGLAGGTALNGLVKIDSFYQVNGVVTATITNATIDGAYSVKLWYL